MYKYNYINFKGLNKNNKDGKTKKFIFRFIDNVNSDKVFLIVVIIDAIKVQINS